MRKKVYIIFAQIGYGWWFLMKTKPNAYSKDTFMAFKSKEEAEKVVKDSKISWNVEIHGFKTKKEAIYFLNQINHN